MIGCSLSPLLVLPLICFSFFPPSLLSYSFLFPSYTPSFSPSFLPSSPIFLLFTSFLLMSSLPLLYPTFPTMLEVRNTASKYHYEAATHQNQSEMVLFSGVPGGSPSTDTERGGRGLGRRGEGGGRRDGRQLEDEEKEVGRGDEESCKAKGRRHLED